MCTGRSLLACTVRRVTGVSWVTVCMGWVQYLSEGHSGRHGQSCLCSHANCSSLCTYLCSASPWGSSGHCSPLPTDKRLRVGQQRSPHSAAHLLTKDGPTGAKIAGVLASRLFGFSANRLLGRMELTHASMACLIAQCEFGRSLLIARTGRMSC